MKGISTLTGALFALSLGIAPAAFSQEEDAFDDLTMVVLDGVSAEELDAIPLDFADEEVELEHEHEFEHEEESSAQFNDGHFDGEWEGCSGSGNCLEVSR